MSLPILRCSKIYDMSSFGFISADGRLLNPSTTVRYELLLGKKKKVFGVSSVCSQPTNKRRWYTYLFFCMDLYTVLRDRIGSHGQNEPDLWSSAGDREKTYWFLSTEYRNNAIIILNGSVRSKC